MRCSGQSPLHLVQALTPPLLCKLLFPSALEEESLEVPGDPAVFLGSAALASLPFSLGFSFSGLLSDVPLPIYFPAACNLGIAIILTG